MDKCFWARLGCTVILTAVLFTPAQRQTVKAETPAPWWDDDWPYRVPITLSETGIVGASLNFSQLFSQSGLNEALLDLGSIRVIPYQNGIPGEPIPYQETYSTLIFTADSFNMDTFSGEPYWSVDDDAILSLDEARFSQGTGSIHSEIHIKESSLIESGFTLNFNDLTPSDWSVYEVLLYDAWPEVNASAIDQAPDLYHFSLEGLKNCLIGEVFSPALMLDHWNKASVSLKPYSNCVSPNLTDINGLRFLLKTATYLPEMGYYEPGDKLQLWLDNFRLVDQDGGGEIRWIAEEIVDRYYVYFDTLNHEGHATAATIQLGEADSIAAAGIPEAGGYFNRISGSVPANLNIWRAPPSEKILKTYQPPVSTKPLLIHAAKGEFEPIQIVIRSPIEQNLPVSVSALVHSNGLAKIPANQFQIFRVDYVPISQITDYYGRLTELPDPLYPIRNGQRVVFPGNENQPLWLRVKIPSAAPAGIYSGLITIGTATVPFSVEVWPFSLPEGTGIKSINGVDWDLLMETYGGTIGGIPQACYAELNASIQEAFADYRINPVPHDEASLPGDVLRYTLSNYEISKAQSQQTQSNQRVWWQFTAQDQPPFSNPAVIDRPGVDARILPWLAWMDRINGLFYPNSTDWDGQPWTTPFSNSMSNGDGYLFYPPKDDTLGFDPCIADSNRLVPSIRLELLREGLEDYAYLQILSGGSPSVGVGNPGDSFVKTLAFSETVYNRIPTAIDEVRLDLARLIIENIKKIYLPLVRQ